MGINALAHPSIGCEGVVRVQTGEYLDLTSLMEQLDGLSFDRSAPNGFSGEVQAYVHMCRFEAVVDPAELLLRSIEAGNAHGHVERPHLQFTDRFVRALPPAIRIFQAEGGQLPEDAEVLVRAQRITAGSFGRGDRIPTEGFHQDDAEVAGILLLARANLLGGVLQFSSTPNDDGLMYEWELEPGDLVVFSQTVYYRIKPVFDAGMVRGYYDMIRFGWSSHHRGTVSI